MLLDESEEASVWKIVVSGVVPIAFASWACSRGSSVRITRRHIRRLCIPDHAASPERLPASAVAASGAFSRAEQDGFCRRACTAPEEAGASGIWGIVCNDSVTRSIYLNDQKSYRELMGEMGDPDWFRSEVDAQRMRNVTLFCGGNSVVMFNSTMQESVTNFCDRIGMEARTNKNGYNGVTS